jgi:DNA-binding transcriptional LysR family regulator
LHSEPRGTLKINAPMSFGVMHIAPAAVDFMRQYPELRVALILNDRFVDPYEEGFDVTLRIGDLQDSGLSARRLAAIERGLYAAPSYLARHGQPQAPADLSAHAALHYGPPGPSPRWSLRGREGDIAVPIQERLCSNNGDVLKAAALAGLGIMLLPAFFVRAELGNGALVQLMPGVEPPPLGLYAVYPPTRFVPAKIRLFIDFLAERFKKLVP